MFGMFACKLTSLINPFMKRLTFIFRLKTEQLIKYFLSALFLSVTFLLYGEPAARSAAQSSRAHSRIDTGRHHLITPPQIFIDSDILITKVIF